MSYVRCYVLCQVLCPMSGAMSYVRCYVLCAPLSDVRSMECMTSPAPLVAPHPQYTMTSARPPAQTPGRPTSLYRAVAEWTTPYSYRSYSNRNPPGASRGFQVDHFSWDVADYCWDVADFCHAIKFIGKRSDVADFLWDVADF